MLNVLLAACAAAMAIIFTALVQIVAEYWAASAILSLGASGPILVIVIGVIVLFGMFYFMFSV